MALSLILISGDISTNPGPRCLCKLCKKRVKDRGIQCDVCNKWLHPDCVGLDETEYLRLGESDETWLCPDCNKKDDLKKDFYSTLQAETNIRGLKVAHINCCGLFRKLTEIKLILQESKIDILGITETHLSDKIKNEEIRIDGYTVQRLDRSNQQGGGCLIYYRDDLDVIPKPKLEVKSVGATWIEVICRSQRLLIGTVYRPPKDKDFYDTFKNKLDDLWTKQNNILLIGDFNSDLMTRNKNDQGKKLQRILNMFGLKNVIKKPTRVAASSETVIDLIISSETSKVIKSGSLDPGISDHKLIYSVTICRNLLKSLELKWLRTTKL